MVEKGTALAEDLHESGGLEVGEDLWIVQVNPQDLHEQTINAQVMDPKDFDQLVDNVAQRGQLESLPYCWRKPGTKKIEIISGHHRVRAANAAKLERIPILLDTSNMSRSTVVAKQIAHNQLSGTSDEATLRVMLEMVDNLDDLVMTGLPDDFLPVEDSNNITLLAPKAEFEWRTVSLTFLPEKLEEFETLIDGIERDSALVAVADMSQFNEFSTAVLRYAGLANIKNVSTAIAELTREAHQRITEIEVELEAEKNVKEGKE